jgi:hypothetical protein
VKEDDEQRLHLMTHEEVKFILKFLVCLVLQNFNTPELLEPSNKENKEKNQTILQMILEENHLLANSL